MVDLKSYFAPCILVNPGFDDSVVDVQDFRLHRRTRDITPFDLATLATKHKLHLPYQLMDVFLSGPANLEVELPKSSSKDEAVSRLEHFRTMLYLNGVTPFIIPYIATHSFNDYAGINSRDSEILRSKLPENLKDGITSETTTVEAWPLELSLMTFSLQESNPVTEEIAGNAAWQVRKFSAIEKKHPELTAARYALTTAPQISHLSSSLLHLWTGLESLFPNVNAELSFRISLLLAEFVLPIKPAIVTYESAKRSYKHRSNAAHGNLQKIGYDEWREAWDLLCTSLLAVIHRDGPPDETALLNSMLARSAPPN